MISLSRIVTGCIVLAGSFSALPGALPAASPESINLRRTITVDVVDKTKDAVVYISTTRLISRRISPFGNDPFWQEFGSIVRVPANSLGSGFIIHPDGYLVTNNHVIDRARQITVELSDGRKLPAELLSADPEADLAILKITSDKPLPALDLGDSSDLMIGEPAIAVGNPLGFSHSVSTGIVSALHRDLKDDRGNTMLADLIQTDAAINPGNSGGPLLNSYGQVIGINTAIRSDAQNIGFAIQVNKLRDLIPALMNPAQVSKVDVPVKLKELRKVIPPATVVSTLYREGSKKGAITSINGHAPHNIIDAYAMLLRIREKEKVELTFDKDASESLLAKSVPLPDAVVQARRRLGITIEALTPMLAQRLGLSAEDGVLVSEVARNSIAAKAGIEPGDIIVQLGLGGVRNLDDFSARLQQLPDSGRVRVGVIRDNQVGFGILKF